VTGAPPVLRFDGLTIDFADGRSSGPAVRAVDDLDLELRRGEVLGLVGESGSGKSVTARSVLGLLPETARVSGRIRLGDEELTTLGEEALRRVRGARVSLVFQEPSTALNPIETVGWQLEEALRAHRRGRLSRAARRTRVVELLTLVGIPDPRRRRDYPHQLSGGQRQRVVIALALANDPEVLIADEPTTALDVTVQAEILDLLRALRKTTGVSVLLITHNMGVIAQLADRVAVMRAGRIVEVGEVTRVFTEPADAYTRDLLAAVPRLGTPVDGRRVNGYGATRDAARLGIGAGVSGARRPAAGEGAARPAADAGPGPVFAATELAVDYPGRQGRPAFRALRDVTLSVQSGEVLGIVGESGSGKSTLGRVAAGLLRPAAGSATVFGSEPGGIRRVSLRRLRQRIGVVYQDPAASLDPLRTVGDAITEPLAIHGVGTTADRRRRVADLLSAVELPASYAHRLPRQLSGGQRQRVAFARAIALGPDLLIADEPTSALDVTVQAELLDLFRSLRGRLGFACLFISHDLAVINEISDRVAVMHSGQVVEQGSTRQILTAPSMAYTRQLLDSVPDPDPGARPPRNGSR
jgi:peptide/nickel transport system ATP-binding protein